MCEGKTLWICSARTCGYTRTCGVVVLWLLPTHHSAVHKFPPVAFRPMSRNYYLSKNLTGLCQNVPHSDASLGNVAGLCCMAVKGDFQSSPLKGECVRAKPCGSVVSVLVDSWRPGFCLLACRAVHKFSSTVFGPNPISDVSLGTVAVLCSMAVQGDF